MSDPGRVVGRVSEAADPDRRLLTAGEVVIGEFRCRPERPDFATAGPITRHCFVFPRCGVWIHQDGHRPFVGDANRTALYNPKQPYERRAIVPAGDRSDWFTVSDRIAREVVARHDRRAAESMNRVFRAPFVPSHPHVYAAQRELHEYVVRARRPDPLLVEETAIDLLAQTVSSLYGPRERPREPAAFTSRHRRTVEQVCELLNATFRANHSLASIAAGVQVSVFHLCRIFRLGTGLPIHAYRQQLRLRHALEALEDPGSDLLAIALELGYSGHSHFTAAFRRLFGAPPSRLRDRFRALDAAAVVSAARPPGRPAAPRSAAAAALPG